MRLKAFAYVFGFCLVVALHPTGDVRAQSGGVPLDQGLPYFVTNFTPEEYGAHHQNWAIVEDRRGVVYVGNTHGVLEYDGSSWRLIRIGNNAVVRSLDIDDNGRVFVGAVGEFGYLAPDSTGSMSYVSLTEDIPADYRTFDDVWGTHVTDDGVYFQTWYRLYRWRDGEVDVWSMSAKVNTSFSVRGRLYLWQRGHGIMHLENDSLAAVPGVDMLAEKPVYAMIPYREEGILIGTYYDGLYLYDGRRIEKFGNELDQFLSEHKLYRGSRLSEDLYAFATLEGGVGIIDGEGEAKYMLDESSGLQDQRVYDLLPDAQGGLWVALYSGITRTVVPSPVHVLDQRRGLKGAVQDVLRHNGSIYVATTRGLYRQTTESSDSHRGITRFDPVPQTPQVQYWSLLSVGDVLLAASMDGVFEISSGGASRIYSRRAFQLHRSRQDDRRVYAGLKDGVMTLYRTPQEWVKEGRIEGITDEIRSIMEDKEGAVWLGTRYEGVVRVEFEADSTRVSTVRKYGPEEGLPGGAVVVSELFGKTLFISRRGVFRAETGPNDHVQFSADSLLSRMIRGRENQLLLVRSDERQRIWLVYDEGVEMYAPDQDGSYALSPTRQLQFPDTKILEKYVDGSTVWFATKDGLLRYTPKLDSQVAPPPSALVRTVTVNDDSLLFAGTYADDEGYATLDPSSAASIHLGYHENNLRFTYAAPSHNKPSATRYQYMLEGFDDGWSRWTTETMKEYTNLPAGDYRFRVRARTVNGAITDEGVFAFEVLPPWYRTWWAYGLYGILLIGALFSYGRYRASVSAKKLEQERRVNERLKAANAELRQANRLKDEFLANMSHELRTPLASILGFADVLDEELDEPQREFVQLIKESGDRLYNTLDALLDLAKFRAGMVELDYSEVNVVQEVDAVIQIFEPKADEKALDLTLYVEKPVIKADMDTFCLERILTNLIGNAIKFTEEGEVSVYVRDPEERVEILVRDTGIGIDEEFLPDIFEAFRQESSGLSRSHQGVGLGLAITKRMVDLMDGTISVKSTKGEGTEFRITFARTRPRATNTGEEKSAPQEARVG